MSNETIDHQTENALRTALSRAALPHSAPDGLHVRLSARTYRTHSTRPVLVAGLAGAAALTGVGLLATGGRAAHGNGNDSGHAHAPTTHLTTAQLTAEVTQAVNGVSGDIFEVNTSLGSGKDSSTHWLSPDGNTLRVEVFSADGSPLADATYVKDGTSETITQVDDATNTWWTGVATVPQGFTCAQFDCTVGLSNSGSAADSPVGGPAGGMIIGAPTSAAGVSYFINQAGFTKTGQTETIDGVANAFAIQSPTSGHTFAFHTDATAFEMQTPYSGAVYPIPGPSGVNTGQIGFTMWIDPTTNLPVQVVSNMGSTSIASNIAWVTPSTANVAQLTVTPPADFTQVPPPAGAAAITASGAGSPATPTTSTTTTTVPPASSTTATTVPSTSTTTTTAPPATTSTTTTESGTSSSDD